MAVFLAAACAYAHADGDPQTKHQLHGAIVAARISGGCAVLLQMIEFQESTQVPGGYDFLGRFVNMEVARLGLDKQEHAKMCAEADQVYRHYLQATEEPLNKQ